MTKFILSVNVHTVTVPEGIHEVKHSLFVTPQHYLLDIHCHGGQEQGRSKSARVFILYGIECQSFLTGLVLRIDKVFVEALIFEGNRPLKDLGYDR